MNDLSMALTPAEKKRYRLYLLMTEFTHGYDDTIIGLGPARKPATTKGLRAYLAGAALAIARGKHHTFHRGNNHRHVCSRCTFDWWHSEASLDCAACHTCPTCGAYTAHEAKVVEFASLYEETKFLIAKIKNLVTAHPASFENHCMALICAQRLRRIKELSSIKEKE